MAFGFGKALPWKIVCNFDEIIAKLYMRERLDYSDYLSVLQPYFLLIDSQDMILSSIEAAREASDARLRLR